MSLKRELDDPRSALRRFLDVALPNVAVVRADWKHAIADSGVHLPAPVTAVPGPGGPRRYPADEIGHAFSVRVALLFTPDAWPAAHIPLRHPLGGPWPAAAEAQTRFSTTAAAATGLVELPRDQERDLLRWCYIAGLFDQLYRTGPLPGMPLLQADPVGRTEDLLDLAPDACLDDLVSLTAAARDRLAPLSLPGQRVVAGPRFAGSTDVGDAEADLLVGNTLVELKVTTSDKLTQRQLQQLVSYALLDYDDSFAITDLVLYSARYATIVVWSLPELLERLAGRPVKVDALRHGLRADLAAGQRSRC